MKKKLSIALTGALAVGLAVPAMAETTFSGTLWVNPMVLKDTVDDSDSIKPVDQRFRFTMTNKINDFASVVWQAEIDTPWGYTTNGTATAKYGSKGYGAALNTDGINLETKHLYLSTKIPDTDFAMKLGLQNINDKTTALYLNNDAAAAVFTYAKDALTVNFGAARPGPADELYIAQVGYKLSDTVALNVDIFNYDFDEDSDLDYSTIGVGAKAAVANFDIDAGIAFQNGDEAEGLALNVGAKTKINEIALGARAIYIADNDDDKGWISLTETPLAGEGLYFFGFSGNANFGLGKAALTTTGDAGVTGLIVNGSTVVATDYTVKGALAYFQALDEDVVGADSADLGTEIAASVTRKLAEKIDVMLYGSYVLVGDYYGDDTEDPYALGLKVTAPF
ncbi:hypothetical protein EPN96_06550 [bacterium]|nr:MAG: hypothetical protein EPN96_06550 [bacterium]